MAKNGELFVLDMGEPVKILDLAKNMIRLSGTNNIQIVETGLRPGEKLYEELLIKTETLQKTENSLIFIEKDTPLEKAELFERLQELEKACETGNDELVREVLKKAVPTYKSPNDINAKANAAGDNLKYLHPIMTILQHSTKKVD
jgi:FlaA1/EpsC-like NDP-sugar epimerase